MDVYQLQILNKKQTKQMIISKGKKPLNYFLPFLTSFMRPLLPSCPNFGMKKTRTSNNFHLKISFI